MRNSENSLKSEQIKKYEFHRGQVRINEFARKLHKVQNIGKGLGTHYANTDIIKKCVSWEQPKHPSMEECIKKRKCGIHTHTHHNGI